MKKILLTGGQSSGKSSRAIEIADLCGEKKYFIATARRIDGETSVKINRHIEERGNRYITVEEPLGVCDALKGIIEKSPDIVVIDCITMWVSNLLIEREDKGYKDELENFLDYISGEEFSKTDSVLVMVTNEVGSGIIPMNELGRKYCSLLGHTNKRIASVCDEVYLMACGLGVRLK